MRPSFLDLPRYHSAKPLPPLIELNGVDAPRPASETIENDLAAAYQRIACLEAEAAQSREDLDKATAPPSRPASKKETKDASLAVIDKDPPAA